MEECFDRSRTGSAPSMGRDPPLPMRSPSLPVESWGEAAAPGAGDRSRAGSEPISARNTTDLGESGAGVGGGALVKGLSQHLLGEDGVAVVLLAVGGDVVGGVDALAVGQEGQPVGCVRESIRLTADVGQDAAGVVVEP